MSAATQLPLLECDCVSGEQRKPRTIQQRFESFHAAHPEIYRQLVELARRLQAQGKRPGIGFLWEWVRYFGVVRSDAEADYALDNKLRSRYARLIMEREPDLRGIFRVRDLRAQ